MHVKAMSAIKVLKLDKNNLKKLPDELYDIKILKELTFSDNQVSFISPKIGQLVELNKLNFAQNKVAKIPKELGDCEEIEQLYIHHNRFTSLPCSLVNLRLLRELGLEWFLYAKPPKPKILTKHTKEGSLLFNSLIDLFMLLVKYKMNQCALITFLENFSDDNFDKNHRDNR
jgi:Leucine-rich repeat (LRR) protein